jgi:hypothetical protein
MKRFLRVIRTPDGFSICPECGGMLDDERSLKRHKAFFGFNGYVFDHWPDNAVYKENENGPSDPFQPIDSEHLRAWLLTQAGHQQPRHVFPLQNRKQQAIIIDFLTHQMVSDRARGEYGWPTVKENGLTIIRPASIAFDKCSERRFGAVCRKVFDVVYKVTGIDFNAWIEGRTDVKDTDLRRVA